MLIDLHVHSSASDGSYSPKNLVDLAIKENVGIIALCDHDTTSGLSEFISSGHSKKITAIPGVELSATWPQGNCHIVGLGLPITDSTLESVLQSIRDSRNLRNEQIIKKLNILHIDVSLEEVEQFAGGEVIARPHIAQILMQKGYVQSVQEAFDSFLAKGGPAYVDRYRLEPQKAIAVLRDAGAFPVLAHPSQLKLSYEEIDELMKDLKCFGLGGIEVFTPYTSDKQLEPYCKIAEKYNLFCSGGSDFHGESKPDHRLGYYRENKVIPEACREIVEKISL